MIEEIGRCGNLASCRENVEVDDSKMSVYVNLRQIEKPAPAVLVIQRQSGVEDFLKVTRMIAREEYVAAAPDLFHREPPDCKDDGPTRRAGLRDIAHAANAS